MPSTNSSTGTEPFDPTSPETHHILTLHTNSSHGTSITTLRRRFFPPRLLKVPQAHICLFRALPGARLPQIISSIESLCQNHQPFSITVTGAFRMAHGVGLNVADSNHSRELHTALTTSWRRQGTQHHSEASATGLFLSKQDSVFRRPHYTIMNFVKDEQKIEDCLTECSHLLGEGNFEEQDGTVKGLQLWRYVEESEGGKQGTWDWMRDFSLGGGGGSIEPSTPEGR